MNLEKLEYWDNIIDSKSSIFKIDYKKIWNYRDLLFLIVRRDFVSFYKQTILGPLWFFIQPFFTTISYTIIFGKLAGMSTDGLSQPLFYLVGITHWNYFSETLIKTSTVFRDNSNIFGKVYFPRIIMPLSLVISNLLRYAIQVLLLVILMIFFSLKGANFSPSLFLFLLPFAIVLMALLGLGLGLIITALTNKYRDLAFLVAFGVQLFMYATPIIYPLSSVPIKYKWIVNLNPLTQIIEVSRLAFLGKGDFSIMFFNISIASVFVILICGIIIFNKVEKNFIDKV